MYYKNGDRYEGFMKNGKKEGQGVLQKMMVKKLKGYLRMIYLLKIEVKKINFEENMLMEI